MRVKLWYLMEREGFSISSLKFERKTSRRAISTDASIYLSQKFDRKLFFSLRCCWRVQLWERKIATAIKIAMASKRLFVPRSGGERTFLLAVHMRGVCIPSSIWMYARVARGFRVVSTGEKCTMFMVFDLMAEITKFHRTAKIRARRP